MSGGETIEVCWETKKICGEAIKFCKETIKFGRKLSSSAGKQLRYEGQQSIPLPSSHLATKERG